MTTRTVKIGFLARVEGEGGLFIKIRDRHVENVELRIFEPPRLFEALLRGRDYSEAPDITARICGICPVAYQMSAVHAMENAFGITVGGQLRALRRLLYCGEWIESHVLHVFMLHAPDFLGYPDAIALAKDHPEVVKRALQMKKAGNAIVSQLGGREVHPINVRVGGFYSVPTKRELAPLAEQLKVARDLAREAVAWSAILPFPDLERDYTFVALQHPYEYPFSEGHIVSNRGLDIPASDYEKYFTEQHVSYSTALHSTMSGSDSYLVGPLARYNLNYDRLCDLAREAAASAGLGPICRNPFKSLVVRAVETLQAFEEALQIIGEYERPDAPSVEVTPRAGVGFACTEAPRGILYHRYAVDDEGLIRDAKIVPPTSQNQRMIEDDLRSVVEQSLDLPDDALALLCEQAVRNYDPCISCSTHFLKMHVDRE